ncbi:MAG: hypothetical protein KGO49_04050 [Gammaproteobacteria bacterium]|nr:hypothetical protein [Gammaproteobacteria bacterium]
MSINALATRALMSCRQAVMASQSTSVPGFPFTAVIPVSITAQGEIITLLAETAPHSRNILIDPRVSLQLHDDLEDNWQAATRLSVLGRMRPLDLLSFDSNQLKESFYLLHPELDRFDESADYHFWILDSVQFRLISGIDKPLWVDRISPDLFELTPTDRQQLNDDLIQQGIQGHVIQACRYGLQVIAYGRIRFLSIAEPVNQMTELFELIKSRQFDDPALID